MVIDIEVVFLALDPTVSSLDDVVARPYEVPLSLKFRVPAHTGGQLQLRHQHGLADPICSDVRSSRPAASVLSMASLWASSARLRAPRLPRYALPGLMEVGVAYGDHPVTGGASLQATYSRCSSYA
jgi:hypothetical protein